jgi:hypothetical protein
MLDEHGCFSFADLSAGDYSLAFYDSNYVPRYERLTLSEGETMNDLQIALRPGGFLSGKILDERHRSPERCWFTLIRAGARGGKSGYINDSGDHIISDDGTFCSPPLGPGRYFLRFAGILRESTAAAPPEPPHLIMQKRLFDFLYPNALDVSNATGFDVQAGQTISDLQIWIPCPVWHTIRGKVTGGLPTERTRISVMFARNIGTLDGVGGRGGASVQQDGTFEYRAQSGVYSAEVCEFLPPEPGGRAHMLRKFATANIRVTNADLYGVEIHIPSGNAV